MPRKKKVEEIKEEAEVIEEIKEAEAKPEEVEEVVIEKKKPKTALARAKEDKLADWVPKTKLGNEVVAGKYEDIADLLKKGENILEPQIVDYLVPDLKEELVYIGGTPGKGGGARRTPTRMTARMHRSGRRFKLSAVMTVGNEDGILGIGKSIAKEHVVAIQKASNQARLNVIEVRRGCGSWECNCGGSHSIPFRTEGKVGSVKVILKPTSVGVGIVADNETKKILKLAGIKDVWVKTFGQTSTRINMTFAVFKALKNLSMKKGGI